MIELYLPRLLQATQNTVLLTLISMPMAALFGLALALMRTSGSRFLSWPATLYIEVIRGTPLLVQLYFIYFTLPEIGVSMGWDFLTFDNFAVGVMCLAGNYAAYEAEIHRAGLQAVERGQREAAAALGLSRLQTFWYIVLPQSLRITVPPMINDLVAMLKDSCLVSIIGVQELLNVALSIGKSNFEVPKLLAEAAIMYLLLSLPCSLFGRWVERKMAGSGSQNLNLQTSHGH